MHSPSRTCSWHEKNKTHRSSLLMHTWETQMELLGMAQGLVHLLHTGKIGMELLPIAPSSCIPGRPGWSCWYLAAALSILHKSPCAKWLCGSKPRSSCVHFANNLTLQSGCVDANPRASSERFAKAPFAKQLPSFSPPPPKAELEAGCRCLCQQGRLHD